MARTCHPPQQPGSAPPQPGKPGSDPNRDPPAVFRVLGLHRRPASREPAGGTRVAPQASAFGCILVAGGKPGQWPVRHASSRTPYEPADLLLLVNTGRRAWPAAGFRCWEMRDGGCLASVLTGTPGGKSLDSSGLTFLDKPLDPPLKQIALQTLIHLTYNSHLQRALSWLMGKSGHGRETGSEPGTKPSPCALTTKPSFLASS